MFGEVEYGQFNVSMFQAEYVTSYTNGTNAEGPSGTHYSFETSLLETENSSELGSTTLPGPVVTGFSSGSSSTETDAYLFTGPPSTMVEIETTVFGGNSGSAPALQLHETASAGHADISGSAVAGQVGGYPGTGAIHDGTTQSDLDMGDGLVSALGGQDVHALEFAGPEIEPEVNGSGTGVDLQEAGASGTETWVSHPSAMGYQRVPTTTSSTSTESNSPVMDSGLPVGGSIEGAAAQLSDFYGGTEQNPTSAQSAPTPRAEQAITNLLFVNPDNGTSSGSDQLVDSSLATPLLDAGVIPVRSSAISDAPGPVQSPSPTDATPGTTTPTAPAPGSEVDPTQPGSQQNAGGGSGAPGSNLSPQPGGYPGGAWNPANWPRWAYTGDPNAPDEYYNAGLAPAGEVYNERKGAAHGVLSVAAAVPGVGMLPAGVNAALYEAEGEHGNAAMAAGEGVAAGVFGWFGKARKAKQLANAERLASDVEAGGKAARAGETAAAAQAAAPKGLPATTEASVADKLERYLLNPDHAVGGPKAKWFEQALGFTKENAADLAKQIQFDEAAATVNGVTEHGTKFNQVITITGANGKTIDTTFAWIRNNDGVVRLVTAIPTPK